MKPSVSPTITAIIPAYNEEATIASVISVLHASSLITEIIVVSDGSTDKTAEVARQAGATFVYELSDNNGKGNAVRYAVSKTTAPMVLFCDADLCGFRSEHIPLLLEPVLSGRLVMNVGIRDRGYVLSHVSRHLPLISGERVLRREIIETALSSNIDGFRLETVLNYICRCSGLPYGSTLLPGLSIRRKYEKVGFLRGIWQYIAMGSHILAAMIQVRIHRPPKPPIPL